MSENKYSFMDDPELQRLRHNNFQKLQSLQYALYESLLISKLNEEGLDVETYMSTVQKALEEANLVPKVQKQEEANEYMSEEFECNIACTTTALQNTENNNKSNKYIKSLEQSEQEITEKCQKFVCEATDDNECGSGWRQDNQYDE